MECGSCELSCQGSGGYVWDESHASAGYDGGRGTGERRGGPGIAVEVSGVIYGRTGGMVE